MKALTLHQPYATLIVQGRKTCETREWAPAVCFPEDNGFGERYTLELAIHFGSDFVGSANKTSVRI